MVVVEAGQHRPAVDVPRVGRPARTQVGADGDDPAVVDQHVGPSSVDLTAPDEERAHGSSARTAAVSAPSGRAEPGTGRAGRGTGDGRARAGDRAGDVLTGPLRIGDRGRDVCQRGVEQPTSPFGQGRRHRTGRGDAGEGIGDRVGQEARTGVVAPDQSPCYRRIVAKGDPVAVRALPPVARDRHPDPRTVGVGEQGLRVEAPLPQHPRPGALDHDIGRLQQAAQTGHRFSRREVEGDRCLPVVEQVEEPGVVRSATVRPGGRLHLHHPGPAEGQQMAAQRPRPERAEVHDEGRRQQRRPGPDPAPGDGVDRRPDLADCRHGQSEEGGPLDQPVGLPGARRLRHRGPRIGRRRGQLQPGGHGVEVLGAGQVDGQPPVGRRQQPGRPATAGRARPGQAGHRGPLPQQRQRVGDRRVRHQGDDTVDRRPARGQGRPVGPPGQPGEPARLPRRGRSRHHRDGSDGVMADQCRPAMRSGADDGVRVVPFAPWGGRIRSLTQRTERERRGRADRRGAGVL